MPTASSLVLSFATSTAQLMRRAPFESVVLVVALVYMALHLSPSSYALALEQLGEPTTPVVGTPRPIRTDEWSVMTPLFQAAVNNNFRETNETSFYLENMRSFIGLPLLNWGLVFKPLVWPFFVVSPALAYSFFWAAIAALTLIGWSVMLRVFGIGRGVAAFTSAILYFSPFVQAWSGPSPLVALFPWVVIAFVCIRSPLRLAIAVAALVPVGLMAMFYLPAVPPLLFLALVLCLALKPEAFGMRRLAGALAGAAIGAGISLAYFAPILRAYADSAYPGRRWFDGGGLPVWQALSQFFPGTTTEHYSNLIAANICEAATVASWLPLVTLCAVDYRQIRRDYPASPDLQRDLRRLSVLVIGLGVITFWQLVPFPVLSYGLGFGVSPEARTVFASGALLLVAAAYAIDRLPLRLTLSRLAIFSTVVIGAWLLATAQLQPTNDLIVRDELLVLLVAVGLVPFAVIAARASHHSIRTALLLIALVPNVVTWGLFNPIQSTKAIFAKPETEITRQLDKLAATRADGSIAVEGIPDAILNGVGYRSVTHVLVTPSPHTFRAYFPLLDDETFDTVFNRYAHISLTHEAEPFVASPDVIRVPITTMSRYAATNPR